MASLYSKRLLATDNLTAPVTETVPAGFAWIVRDIDVLLDAALGTVAINVAMDNGTIAPTFFYVEGPTGPAVHQWRGRQVLVAGDQLIASPAGSGLIQVMISGYELSLP